MKPSPCAVRDHAVAAAALAAALAFQPAIAVAQVPHLTRVGAIGCELCEGPEAFGSVLGLALLSDGGVAVVDRDEPMVRLFGPDGAVLRAFGRSGRGPGELGTPSGIAATDDGMLLVADLRRPAITRYTLEGEEAGSFRVSSMVSGLTGSPDGLWVAYELVDWSAMATGVHLLRPGLVEAGTPLPTTAGVIHDGEGRPALLISSAAGPDGRVAVGHGADYLIKVFTPEGALVHEIRREVDPVARTPEELDALAARLRRGPGVPADNPEGSAQLRKPDPFHPHFAARALAYDDAARLWVRTPRGGPAATVFDLFSPTGSYLGEVRAELPIGQFAVSGGRLAGVVADPDTGIQRVVLWRVEEE